MSAENKGRSRVEYTHKVLRAERPPGAGDGGPPRAHCAADNNPCVTCPARIMRVPCCCQQTSAEIEPPKRSHYLSAARPLFFLFRLALLLLKVILLQISRGLIFTVRLKTWSSRWLICFIDSRRVAHYASLVTAQNKSLSSSPWFLAPILFPRPRGDSNFIG